MVVSTHLCAQGHSTGCHALFFTSDEILCGLESAMHYSQLTWSGIEKMLWRVRHAHSPGSKEGRKTVYSVLLVVLFSFLFVGSDATMISEFSYTVNRP